MPDRLLMGPGPSNPYPEVVAAFAQPLLGHLDPEFLRILDETCDRLRTVFRTTNALTLPISGTGSAGMEACFVNLVEPGDTVDRRRQRRVRRAHVRGRPPLRRRGRAGRRAVGRAARSAAAARRAARAPRARVVASCTRRPPPASRTTSLRSRPSAGTDTLLLVDTVTSLGGIPLDVDGWGIDACYSGTQKCLGVPPGLSPVTFSRSCGGSRPDSIHAGAVLVPRPRAHRRLRGDRAQVPPHRADRDDRRVARRTRRGARRGAPAVWARHRAVGTRLQDALTSRGSPSSPLPMPGSRSSPPPGCPTGLDEAHSGVGSSRNTRSRSAAASGRSPGVAWRIGLMGHTARPRSVDRAARRARRAARERRAASGSEERQVADSAAVASAASVCSIPARLCTARSATPVTSLPSTRITVPRLSTHVSLT